METLADSAASQDPTPDQPKPTAPTGLAGAAATAIDDPPPPPVVVPPAAPLKGRAARAVKFFDAHLDKESPLRAQFDGAPADEIEAAYELVCLAQGHYENEKPAEPAKK